MHISFIRNQKARLASYFCPLFASVEFDLFLVPLTFGIIVFDSGSSFESSRCSLFC